MLAPQVIWRPQPGPQTALLECPVFEIFYGGARGGGKTDGTLGKWLQHQSKWRKEAKGIIVRRKLKQLEDMIARAKTLYLPLRATYNDQKSTFFFPNGATLKFRYLEKDADADEYIGHSYTFLGVEEMTNFPSPEPINKLRATLRSGAGVHCEMVGTGNPGGPGHSWVKKRYIDPCPTGYKILKESFINPFTGVNLELERTFIPSKLPDNKILTENDPFYVARLQQQGSARLVDAWLRGDWDVVLGSFFDCFDTNRHVMAVSMLEAIPYVAKRFRAFDWGSAKPFAVGWFVLSDGSWGLPESALLMYREYYGTSALPSAENFNVGLKLTAEQVAEGITDRELGETMAYGAADPQIFVEDGGPSLAKRMFQKKVSWLPADNRRKTGWDQVRQLLLGTEGVPALYFSETCEHMIRTLPIQQHDENDPEDVDTEGEDHMADMLRYACMSRPLLKRAAPAAGVQYPKAPAEMTLNELIARRTSRRKAEEAERFS